MMADKKRKGAASAQLPPQKKSKKAEKLPVQPASSVAVDSIPPPAKNDMAAKSKANRKRAADFLDEDEVAGQQTNGVANAQKSSSKKSKKVSVNTSKTSSVQRKGQQGGETTLTADGINGVVEHPSELDLETATDVLPVQKSLMAEGLRTADGELGNNSDNDKVNEDNSDDESDHGAALLAGFDSDTEDVAEDKGLDLSKTGTIPNYKKTTKKLRNAAQNGSNGPGVVYVGRIPHGFYEKQMREYFGQFGDISKLRLSRNRRTGASKHFAFIEFASDEVAKIVAETMDNYLMFGHILKCKYAPAENLHPDVWKGANKKYRKIPHEKLERQKLEAPKTAAQWDKKNRKEQQKRTKNAAKLAELGYSLPLPALKSPSAALALRKVGTAATSNDNVVNGEIVEDSVAIPTVAEDAPKKAKRGKKTKVDPKPANPLTEGNLGAQDAVQDVTASAVGQSKNKRTPGVTRTLSLAPNVDHDEVKAEVSAPKKSKKTAKGAKAISMSSDKGDFDNLSSVPIGIDAAGDETAQAWGQVETGADAGRTIETSPGVADAVLKERKQGRKKDRKKSRSTAD